jgi:hypothetical protein
MPRNIKEKWKILGKSGNFGEKSTKSWEITKPFQKFSNLEYFMDLKHFWSDDLFTNFFLPCFRVIEKVGYFRNYHVFCNPVCTFGCT